ncbi:MAG: ArsR family transcriptional regulator [Bryobacterales bacterium]|nr:ArsR family transcriptional regulator [Bryobacterales bacterium]
MALEPAILHALASPRRQEILRLVWRDEQTAGAIHRAMPDVTFGAVSLQLRRLLEAGLVEARAGKENDRRNRYYRANREALAEVAGMLERMWDDALWKLKLAAEMEESRRGPRPHNKKNKKGKKR